MLVFTREAILPIFNYRRRLENSILCEVKVPIRSDNEPSLNGKVESARKSGQGVCKVFIPSDWTYICRSKQIVEEDQVER